MKKKPNKAKRTKPKAKPTTKQITKPWPPKPSQAKHWQGKCIPVASCITFNGAVYIVTDVVETSDMMRHTNELKAIRYKQLS